MSLDLLKMSSYSTVRLAPLTIRGATQLSSSVQSQDPSSHLSRQSSYSAARTSSLNRKPKAAANSFATSIPTLSLYPIRLS